MSNSLIGIVCPACGGPTKVLWTRPQIRYVRRRHLCKDCGEKATSVERLVHEAPPEPELIDKQAVLAALRQVCHSLRLE